MAADSPPPPPKPPGDKATSNTSDNLPPSSKFPVIASAQYRYTAEDAVRDLPKIPRFIYRVRLSLPAAKGTNFQEIPWPVAARRFYYHLLLTDPDAIILKRRPEAPINKISSHEEIPSDPIAFERDYVYEVKRQKTVVSFKMILATSRNFTQTFKSGSMFQRMRENKWYIHLERLETQGLTVVIAHFPGAHNRFTNQDALIADLQQLFAPTVCNDIDIIITQPRRKFTRKDGKTETIHTRWPSLACPSDTAAPLTKLLLERWPKLKTMDEYKHSNLRHFQFLPTGKGIISFSTFIQKMIDNNEFLYHYNQVTVIYRCSNMDTPFLVTEDLSQSLKASSLLNKHTTLRQILLSWLDDEKPVVYSIDRSYEEGSYTILSHRRHAPRLRQEVEKLVQVLKDLPLFESLSTGGTAGPSYANLDVSSEAISYLNSINTSNVYHSNVTIQDISNEDLTDKSLEQQKAKGWSSPPPSVSSKKGSRPRPIPNPTVIDLTNRSAALYRDVVVAKDYSVPTSISSPTPSSLTIASNTIEKRKVKGTADSLVTVKQYMNSNDFRDQISKIIAPQVQDLINPTISKINNIETSVEELHEYVETHEHWQRQQTNRQQETNDELQHLRTDVSSILDILNRSAISTQSPPQPKRTFQSPTSTSTPNKRHQYVSQESPLSTPPPSIPTMSNQLHQNSHIQLRPGTSLGSLSQPAPPLTGTDDDNMEISSPSKEAESGGLP